MQDRRGRLTGGMQDRRGRLICGSAEIRTDHEHAGTIQHIGKHAIPLPTACSFPVVASEFHRACMFYLTFFVKYKEAFQSTIQLNDKMVDAKKPEETQL